MDANQDAPWPSLSREAWEPTKQTLHRYLQVVGKVRLALVPPRPDWSHTTLFLTDRGLTTGRMPHRGRELEISFDLVDHRLLVATGHGPARTLALGARPACADFYRDLVDALDDLGLGVHIRPVPYDLDGPTFPDDTVHRTYDAEAVTGYWRVLTATEAVLTDLVPGLGGEAGPVHLFWHRLDLSCTVASGAQVASFGFGGELDASPPTFHYHVSPEPDGLSGRALTPSQARWQPDGAGHRAVLAYDDVRAGPVPRLALLEFYRSASGSGTRRPARGDGGRV